MYSLMEIFEICRFSKVYNRVEKVKWGVNTQPEELVAADQLRLSETDGDKDGEGDGDMGTLDIIDEHIESIKQLRGNLQEMEGFLGRVIGMDIDI